MNVKANQIQVFNNIGSVSFLVGMFPLWIAKGWRVDPIAAVQFTEYKSARGLKDRYLLRFKMYLVFAVRCVMQGIFKRDVAIRLVTTNPFYAPALMAFLSGGRTKVVQLVYDVYPDAAIAAGFVRPRGLLCKLMKLCQKYALRRCASTVFLGPSMSDAVQSAYGAARSSAIIPVGADGRLFDNMRDVSRGSSLLIFAYVGQMGRMHDSETLCQFLTTTPLPDRVVFRFFIGGRQHSGLSDRLRGLRGIEISGGLGDREWVDEMQRVSVALVTMSVGSDSVVLPSKVYSSLLAGQAILAICPQESDLANLVRDFGCGWVVSTGDVEGLRQCFLHILSAPEELKMRRAAARRIGMERFDVRKIAMTWHELFGFVLSNDSPRRLGGSSPGN